VITSKKIEEWIKELEERPDSAPIIIQYIVNRLRELSDRNEELLEENIALLNGKRVQEYEGRIAHLEYQLEVLKRRFAGGSTSGDVMAGAARHGSSPDQEISILVYDFKGRVFRTTLQPSELVSGDIVGHLQGELSTSEEPVGLLGAPSSEELLFLYSSGRVAAIPAPSIPTSRASSLEEELDWVQCPIPDEPRGGEFLASLIPISTMALKEFFVQTSRRGYVKKIHTAMAQSILENHYIGTSARQKGDKTLNTVLCDKDDRLVLVSQEGYLLGLEIKGLPFSIEEAMRLGHTDHLVSAFVAPQKKSILVMTQIGKVIHLTDESLEFSETLKMKGQPVFSAQRRHQGVRVVGAAAVREDEWGAALHQDGKITIHAIRDVLGAGKILAPSELLAFASFPLPAASGDAGQEQP
jgi:DNA gyrase/topoisomerase IV subunit A